MAVQSVPNKPSPFENTKALLFDVFGTVVDWRSTVQQELVRRAHEKVRSTEFQTSPASLQANLRALADGDWAKFAQQWRDSYGKFTRTFVPGTTPWKDIDQHHYDSLVELLDQWRIAAAFNDEEVRSLSVVWHRLKPWDDSAPGLRMLGTRFITATLSNGNQSLLKDLDEHGHLGFQELISSADFKAYKPNLATYLGAANRLRVRPDECAMVAAHLGDLNAARSFGMKTIYVERPQEEAWASQEELLIEARGWVDLWVEVEEEGLVEVAKRLGISD